MFLMSSYTIRHRAAQLLLLCVFTTMLCALFLNHMQDDPQVVDLVTKSRNTRYLEEVRREKLKEYQKIIFKNPRRPPDETYNINISLSESIPLERHIKDARPERCKAIQYDRDLPTVSVILIFYNEALSLLLRTVHSILMRTPEHLLEEIILVNDHSLNEDLFDPLEKYVKLLPDKVKLIRTERREGLIRARLIGASRAKGQVLMFQDAHTENNAGWAEPLLSEIKKDPKIIIQPTVDQIDAQTIEYIRASNTVPLGGFSWDLRYTWMEMPKHEWERIGKNPAAPFRTPALVGCALAVHKEYFLHIGGFDDRFNIWGGENIEIAWRYWMCGSGAYTHPCSRVAHTFKPFAYKFDGDREKVVQKNLMRTADLWMDDWIKYFHASSFSWSTKRTYFTESERASLEIRREMRRQLQCKDFTWYMKTIFPHVPRPVDNSSYYGEVANEKSEACWFLTKDNYVGLTYFCFFHRILPENIFYVDSAGRLRYRDHRCIRVNKLLLLSVGECEEVNAGEKATERWSMWHTGPVHGLIRVRYVDGKGNAHRLCLLQVTNVNKIHKGEQMPQLTDCDEENRFQRWRWTYKFDWSYNYDSPF